MSQAREPELRYRDLLSAVLVGESVATVPVSAWRHYPILDQDADTLTEVTLAHQARFDCDFVKLMPASTWQSRDHGLNDRWAGDAIGRREVTTTVIQTPDDWQRLRRLDPWNGFSGHILRAARQVRRTLAPEIPVLTTVFNPLFQAVQLAGLARVREHAQHHPGALAQGLATLLANTLAAIEQLADLRLDGIFLVTQHAGRAMLAPEPYVSLALDSDRACLTAAPLPFNLLHLHGSDLCWELFLDLDSVVIHYDAVAGNPDPVRLSKRLAGGLATGPHPQGAMLNGSPAELMAEVTGLRRRMRGRPFMLAPGCALPLAVPDHQVDALIQAARAPLSESDA
ncbi:hypothetical protein CCR95_04600 [Thiocystis minor]|uniref:uroporphyrinogen decarboxylase family protein n=1 Tax=Thiocystis minor TaxID=61597 RepID=UPI00191384BB|nr:uroporphyrinogen decarboxylase family protein [Thiocystis minor]MBK5963388.1 hypothetical protein [Thiocystis minor]